MVNMTLPMEDIRFYTMDLWNQPLSPYDRHMCVVSIIVSLSLAILALTKNTFRCRDGQKKTSCLPVFDASYWTPTLDALELDQTSL